MLKLPSYSRNRLGILLCLLGVLCAVVSAWMIYPPAGIAVAALSLLLAGYITLYLEARNASTRQPAASN